MGISLALRRSRIELGSLALKEKQTANKMSESHRLELQPKIQTDGLNADKAIPEIPLETVYIERCKNGDQQAFGLLIEMHQDKVYNLAFRILQNAEEADDAAQEAFFKVWQALPNFRGDAKFSTWLYRIVHNHCLNRLRANKSNPRTVSVETSYDDEGEERDILTNIAGDEGDNPSLQFEGQEQREVIWNQIDALPAKYRAIIAMYYSDELSYEEIAEVLDIPVGTVKTHLYRAKAQLKTRLTELGNQGIIDIKRQ